MRSTAGSNSRTLTSERTTAGAGRRTAAGTDERTTGGVSRPTLAGVAGREKKSTGDARGSVGTGGWAGYKRKREERTERFPRLEVKDDSVAIRFAEPELFAFIYRHWVSKKPYTCIADAENDVECPLCEAGDRAKAVVFYNVITVEDNVLRVWEMTSEPTRKVQKHYEKLADADKTLDDPGLYFVVSKSKKDNGFFEYEVEKVRAADLNDETGLDPLGEDEIAEAIRNHGKGLFTDDIIQVSTKADLREAVDDIKDTD